MTRLLVEVDPEIDGEDFEFVLKQIAAVRGVLSIEIAEVDLPDTFTMDDLPIPANKKN